MAGGTEGAKLFHRAGKPMVYADAVCAGWDKRPPCLGGKDSKGIHGPARS